MKKFVVRTYSQAREDIFNISVNDLPEYSILYKMLYDPDIHDEMAKAKTAMD